MKVLLTRKSFRDTTRCLFHKQNDSQGPQKKGHSFQSWRKDLLTRKANPIGRWAISRASAVLADKAEGIAWVDHTTCCWRIGNDGPRPWWDSVWRRIWNCPTLKKFYFWLTRGSGSTEASLALIFFHSSEHLRRSRELPTKNRYKLKWRSSKPSTSKFWTGERQYPKLKQKLSAPSVGEPFMRRYGPKFDESEFYTVLQQLTSHRLIAPQYILFEQDKKS